MTSLNKILVSCKCFVQLLGFVYSLVCIFVILFADYQKLEREARICRLLKHPNIGECKINLLRPLCSWLSVRPSPQTFSTPLCPVAVFLLHSMRFSFVQNSADVNVLVSKFDSILCGYGLNSFRGCKKQIAVVSGNFL